MHTVIITDRHTTPLFTEYRRLFAPFLSGRGGSICHCTWNEAGTDIEQAVPDLYKTIKGHPEWRVIILVNTAQEELFNPHNPFGFKCKHGDRKCKRGDETFKCGDEKCKRDEGLLIQENPVSLVRLTHMLAGFPPLGIKEYKTGCSYFDESNGIYKDCLFDNENLLRNEFDKCVELIRDIYLAAQQLPPLPPDQLEKFKEKLKEKREEDIREKFRNGDYMPLTIVERLVDKLGESKIGENNLSEKEIKLRESIRKKLFSGYTGNIKTRLVEIPYTEKEKAEHERLTKKYAFKENRPVEVLLLATREISVGDDREEIREAVRHAWEFHNEEDSSDFWKIYPNTCRFLCYDIVNPDHTLHQRELWRFYLLVLTLAVNQVPGQVLQAYFLYKADLQMDPHDLGRVLDDYINKLLTVQSIIQERMMRVPELTQEKKTELVPIQDISVRFDNVDEGDVRVDGEELGLASDCPISEIRFWRDYIQETKQTIDNILSAPQEIVAAKAVEMRRRAYVFSGMEQVLDRFQIDRIRKRINELEVQVVNAKVYGMLDADVHVAEITKAGETMRKHLGLRLTKRNVLLVSLCSLLVYLCGYIPYLVNSAKISWSAFGTSFGLVIFALALLAAGGLFTLWLLRRRLLGKLQAYNKNIRAIFDHINEGSQVYSDYFSSVCTYMYARSLLSGVILKKDNDRAIGKIQKAHLAAIKDEVERNRKLCSLHELLNNESSIDSVFVNISESLLDEILPSDSQLYEYAPNKIKDTLELENTGETLYAPYTFIKSMSLTREEIYDRKEA